MMMEKRYNRRRGPVEEKGFVTKQEKMGSSRSTFALRHGMEGRRC